MNEINMHNPIIFYDGDCGFCNSTVQFVLNKRKKNFYFLALQSNLAKELLSEHKIQVKMDTIYYLNDNKIYSKSNAALQISKGLKGIYPVLICYYIIPKFIRDYMYDLIAKRRHRIKAGFCLIPEKNDEIYILSDKSS